jgi:hypothetical protein
MNRPNLLSNATLPHVASLISRSPLWRGFPAGLLVLGLFALSPTARAVDPPDGGYPGNNTAEGDGAGAIQRANHVDNRHPEHGHRF